MKNRFASGVSVGGSTLVTANQEASLARKYKSETNSILNQQQSQQKLHHQSARASDSFNDLDDLFFDSQRKNSIIKLRMPVVEVAEIYDISYMNSNFWHQQEQQPKVASSSMTSSTTSTSSSSSTGYSLASYLSVSPTSGVFDSLNQPMPISLGGGRGSITPRSSISKSVNGSSSNNADSGSSILFSDFDDNGDQPFTFKDFVSTVITSENREWHRMIIMDIGRLLELKFKDFKRAYLLQNPNEHTSITLSKRDDAFDSFFVRIAEQIFELGLDEPNSILGSRLQLKLQLQNGKCYECTDLFAYDSSTMTTNDISVTIYESQLSKNGTASSSSSMRKLIQKLKIFNMEHSSNKRSLVIDSVDYNVVKNRLY